MPCTSEEFQRIAGLISRAVDLTPQNDAMARCVDRVATECLLVFRAFKLVALHRAPPTAVAHAREQH